MDFFIAAAVFPVIFIAEFPDKTMVATIVLAARGKPLAVWLGIAAAFAVHVAIATTVGMAAVVLLPRRALEALVAVMFLAGAFLVVREARHERKTEPAPQATAAAISPGRAATTAFLVIFIGEWGDLTQILTANLAAQYRSALSVGVGALLGLWAVSALAVTGGRWLRRVVSITTIRAGTAVLLTGLAAYSGWIALN